MGRPDKMVGFELSASVSPVAEGQDGTKSPRTSAGKVIRFPRPPMPSRDDYLDAFARLVWLLYGQGSLEGTSRRAFRETMMASPDTWARMIHPKIKTQKPDAYLVDYVKRIAHDRGIAIPAELMVAQ